MAQDLSREQFELLRKVLREKKEEEAVQGDEIKPRKRRKRHGDNPPVKVPEPAPIEVVVLDSSDSDNSMSSSMEDEDFDSDEFEDVLPEDESDDQGEDDLNITIDKVDKKAELAAKKLKEQQQRNVVSHEVKKYRKDFHAEYLLCLMVHGYIRNEWLNDDKLLNRLFKKHIIPEKVEKLLHPTLDKELPLRSTRKLLDGLKQAMQLWIKHCHIIKSYAGVGLYMRQWDEISTNFHNQPTTKQQFIKDIVRGRGTRDILAQGFVALLRAYNVNARLCFSCQPPDYCNMKLNHKSAQSGSNFIDNDTFKYPIFWCEVWDKFTKKWITVDPINMETIEQIRHVSKLEPDSRSSRNVMRYVIAYDRKQGCKDVTRRYVKHMYSYKFRHSRITNDPQGQEWYDRVVKKLTLRKRMKIDDYEDVYFQDRNETEGMPGCLQDFKNHPVYILAKDIKQTQLLKVDAKECGFFKLNSKKQSNKVVKVFYRKDIIELHSPRQWYQMGRVLKPGARFKKIIQKRGINRLNSSSNGEEEEDKERLYSIDETEIYTPPNANELGEIKKNTYGNIEIFAQSMIPHNCVLIESPVAIKACKFIRIEYAPAVTSFSFGGKKLRGKGNVKPVISGVVVARWFKDAVVAAISGIEYSLEQDKQQESELKSLQDWNEMLLRLRIKSNLNETYGLARDEPKKNDRITNIHDEEEEEQEPVEDFQVEAGGFFIGNRENAGSKEFELPPLQADGSQEYGSPPLQGGGFLSHSKSESDPSSEMEQVNEDQDENGHDVVDGNTFGIDDEYDAFMDDITNE